MLKEQTTTVNIREKNWLWLTHLKIDCSDSSLDDTFTRIRKCYDRLKLKREQEFE